GENHWLYLSATSNLATLLARHGDVREAQRLVLEVLPALEQAARSGSGMDPGYYAAALGTLADTQLALGEARAAADSYRKALGALEPVDPQAYAEIRAELEQGLAKSEAAAAPRNRCTAATALSPAVRVATTHAPSATRASRSTPTARACARSPRCR